MSIPFHTKNNIISYNISSSPIDHYKKTVASPLLDSLIIQMQDRFSDEDHHARHLLCLVPSIIDNKAMQLDDEVEGMLVWEKDIPFVKSLGNEESRWKTLWQSTDRESGRKTFRLSNPLEMRKVDGKHSGSQQIGSLQTTLILLVLGVCDEDALPNIYHLLVIACTLPITSAEAERSFSLMK